MYKGDILPPNPQMDWYVAESVTTMSASPMDPLVPKFMGEEPRFWYVKYF
jgi:hypothetical protein